MSDDFELTEEYVFRIAPDGKSTKSAMDLVTNHAFSQPKRFDRGLRLEAVCQGTEEYVVRVDVRDSVNPGTSCNCMSFKRPCKHALGLMFLAIRQPEVFEVDESTRKARRNRDAMLRTSIRQPAHDVADTPPRDTREAIYQAILTEPDEDTPRLVYADWLEEHGEANDLARAEFIRLQIELARRPLSNADDAALLKQEKALWKAHKTEWLGTLPEQLRKRKNISFQRGFFEELRVPTSIWAACADELFAHHPVHRLIAPTPLDRHRAGALVVLPHLSHVRELTLKGLIDQPTRTLEILFSTPFFSNLKKLDVSEAEFGTRELSILAASPIFPRLRELRLTDANLGPKGIQLLVESPQLDNLQKLVFCDSSLSHHAFQSLTERFEDRLVVDT